MEEWKEYKLGDIAIVKGGKRLPKGINLITTPNSHPYIRVRDLGSKKCIELDSTYEYVDDDTQKLISNYIVHTDDIIISIVGTIGLIAIIGKTLNNANLTENCVKLIDLKNIEKDFLYYYLISDFGKQEIDKGIVGAVQAKLPIKNIQAITIKAPDICTQRKISSILKSLDDKIENNRRINENIEQQAQALFKSWFVDFEPFRDQPFVDSELGMIPEGWKVGTINSIANKVTDGVHNTVNDLPDGKYLLLSAKNIKNGNLEITSKERTIDKDTFDKLRSRTNLSKGDILLTSVGTIGELLLLKEDPSNYEFQRSVAIIKPNYDFVSSEFVYLSLKSRIIDIKHMAHGAVQQCIFIGDLKDFKIILSPYDVINSFTFIVNPIFDQIKNNQDESLRLAQLRDTLLPKLMSGEISL